MQPARRGPRRRSEDNVRRVRDLLRAELTRGFPSGRLPAEEQLMGDYHASRATIRDALALLRAEGVIDRVQGIGTLVLANKEQSTIEQSSGVETPNPGSWFAGRMRVSVLDNSETLLPRAVARRLGLDDAAPGRRIDYVALLEDEPMWVATNYMRAPQAALLDNARFETDFYAYLRDSGIQISETTALFEAALADEYDAALLSIATGAAIMWAEQTLFDEDGAPFNFALVRSRGDRSALFSRARRPDSGRDAAEHRRSGGESIAESGVSSVDSLTHKDSATGNMA
jgi:GntR family transcriptional regulator